MRLRLSFDEAPTFQTAASIQFQYHAETQGRRDTESFATFTEKGEWQNGLFIFYIYYNIYKI